MRQRPHAKIEAARILEAAGWTRHDIARAVAAPLSGVEQWLDDPDYHPRNGQRRVYQECGGCSRRDVRLWNNGLCADCTNAKHEALIAMREAGATWSEVAEAFGITPRAASGLWQSRRRKASTR